MKRFLAIALVICAFSACNKESENKNQYADGTDYTSIREYDATAVRLGNIGYPIDDYRHENWPDWIFAAFKPLDTVSLIGYPKQPDITVDALYPNPCKDTQSIKYFAKQPVNLKLMIIDKERNVLFLKSYHLVNGKSFLGLSYKDLNLIPETFYRMFYGFSAENAPFYIRGHIDLKVIN